MERIVLNSSPKLTFPFKTYYGSQMGWDKILFGNSIFNRHQIAWNFN